MSRVLAATLPTRYSHREPDDGPRVAWAPLAILITSLALWAGILIGAAPWAIAFAKAMGWL